MTANKNFSLRDIGDVHLLVPLKEPFQKERVIIINEPGTLLWNSLLKSDTCTCEELAGILIKTYGIDQDTALADTNTFLSSLEEKGAITYDSL